jgi:hypothetical protein
VWLTCFRRSRRVCGRTIRLRTGPYHQTQSDFVVGQILRSVERERNAGPAIRSRVPRASRFCLAKVKAVAHLRHHVPPARIGQATADPLDMCVPVTASRVWILSPQHDVKILEGSIFGNSSSIRKSSVTMSISERATNVQMIVDVMAEPLNGTVFGGLSLSAWAIRT